MNKRWKLKALSEVTEIIGGGTPKTNIKDYWDGDIVWLSPTDLPAIGEIAAVNNSKSKITQEGLHKSSAKLLPKGTVVFSSRASIGKIGITEVELATNQGFTNFVCKEEVDNYYLAYALRRYTNEIAALSNSTTFAEVSKSSLKAFTIPVPPISEQKQIVDRLNNLFKRIDNSISLVETNIDNTLHLLTASLNVVFEDLVGNHDQRPLGTFDKIVSGGTPLRSNVHYWGGNIPWITSGELNQTYINTSKEFITELGLKNSNAKLFPKGTLLCGMYDTAAMKMSILDFEATCNQAIVGVKPKEDELDVLFLKYQLEYLKPVVLEQRQGVRQQNLNAAKIKAIQITVPPLDTQHRIKKYLSEIENKQLSLLESYRQKHSYLKELKESILDAAFKGELNNTSWEALSEQSVLVD